MGIIYKVTNRITGDAYVGATKYSLEKRWDEHLRVVRADMSGFKLHEAIRDYGEENFDVEIIEEVPNDILADREVSAIRHYDTYYNGYNSTLGGPGSNQIEYEKIWDLWDRGYNYHEIMDALDVCPMTVHNALKDYVGHSAAESRHRGKRNQMHKVRQYDFDGNFVAEYESTADAARAYDVDRTLISAVCRHKRPSGVGYQWRYADEEPPKSYALEQKNRVMVQQYDTVGRLVNLFDSIASASQTTGIDHSSISMCCSGKYKTAGGYIWRYAE